MRANPTAWPALALVNRAGVDCWYERPNSRNRKACLLRRLCRAGRPPRPCPEGRSGRKRSRVPAGASEETEARPQVQLTQTRAFGPLKLPAAVGCVKYIVALARQPGGHLDRCQ